MNEQELIPHLFRTEFSKIVSVLCKTFGLSNIQLAEDITSEAFMIAAETWGLKGIPENPAAWLYRVAKNKAKDHFKHRKVFIDKVQVDLKHGADISEEMEIDLSDQSINDSQLQMLFAVCQPLIAKEAQIGLALRILCGFGIEEIATAFISNKETINKRLFRAKEKLRKQNAALEFPPTAELDNRLDNVLSVLYLLYNEGYYSATADQSIKKDLCVEAMRLTLLLLNYPPTNQPRVNALMALMCFQSSRFEARINEAETQVLYYNQNRDLWNHELIERGEYYLNQSAVGENISKYHLEAGISFWHAQKEDDDEKWENILQLYNQLLQIEYSPITALNRTYALSKANSKEEAIKEAEKIDLKKHHLYHALLADLYEGIDKDKVLSHLQSALKLAKSEGDKQMIRERIDGKV